jgi:hypothetical protein
LASTLAAAIEKLAPDDGLLPALPIDRVAAVDQQIIRAERQLLDGAAHGFERSLANVDAVDGLGVHRRNGPANRMGANLPVKGDALFFRELFRVVQAVELEAGRQNHRRRHHRPEERSAARLVNAGNAPRPAPARILFQRPTANRSLGHFPSVIPRPV